MLLRKLAASILWYALTGTRVIRAGEATIRADQDSSCCLILWLTLKFKDFIKMNLSLMMVIQEIIYLI